MSAVITEAPSPMARILDVTEEQYHADPCATPSLNQSIAHILNTKSPLHAYAAHPRLGNAPRETTVPQIEGTVIHALLLGKGLTEIDVLPFDNYKKKVAQVKKAAVLALGRTPVLSRKYDEIVKAAETIRKNLAEQGMVFEGGQSEVAIEWYEEGHYGPVLCRGRLDYLRVEPMRAWIFDPKKIISADPRTCMRHADDFGLHGQRAAYTSAVEKVHEHLTGRVEFRFGFHELDAPHAVAVRDSTGAAAWAGQQQWLRAVAIWEHCLYTGQWPGYPIEPLDVSPWTMKREEEYAEQQ